MTKDVIFRVNWAQKKYYLAAKEGMWANFVATKAKGAVPRGRKQYTMPLNFPFDRFLVVDDNPVDTYITTRVLQKAQLVAQVDTVTTGKAALAYLQRCHSTRQYPEVIFLDVNMPVISGFDFLEQCSAKGLLNVASVKIIMLTSSIHPKDQQQAAHYPVTDYLIKPLKLHSLLKALRVPCF